MLKKGLAWFLVLGLLLLNPGLVACRESENRELDKLIFALDWTPNTNHSGLFLARDRGYFLEQSIDIEFRETDMNFLEMVATGTATFGMAGSEQVLQARASRAGLPVVAIAAVLQENSSGLASPSDRRIRELQDLEGKTYSGWGTELELAIIRALMEGVGADFQEVRIINQSAGNFIASMELEADFAWIYYAWDGIICELENYPISFLPIRDLDPDLNFYSPVLISNDKTLEERPDLVRRFLAACERGYREAAVDPEAACDAVMKAGPGLDRDLVLKSQAYINPFILTDQNTWGMMDLDLCARFAAWMEKMGLLDGPVRVDEAFNNSFLSGAGKP